MLLSVRCERNSARTAEAVERPQRPIGGTVDDALPADFLSSLREADRLRVPGRTRGCGDAMSEKGASRFVKDELWLEIRVSK